MATFTIAATDWRKTFFGSETAEQLTTGAHTVTIAAGGILDSSASEPNAAGRIDAILGLGAATNNAVWTINVNGSLHGRNTGVAPAMEVSGLGLYNGFGATANRINVGADGTIYARDYGVYTTARAAVVNNGVIGGERGGLLFAAPTDLGPLVAGYGEGKVGTNLLTTTLAVDATAATATAVSAANNAVIAANITVTNGKDATIYSGTNDYQSSTGSAIKNLGATGLNVTNAGLIVGGTESLLSTSVAGSVASLDAAVFSNGRLTLTNAVTGTIAGSVSTKWFGATVTNAGAIYGGVEMQLDTDSGNMFDTDRDGRFNDTVGGAVGAQDVTTLVGLRLTNSGVLSQSEDVTLVLPAEALALGLNGTRDYAVITDDARDTITNTGIIRGDLYLAGGADSVSNSGALGNMEDIFAGDGNDTITNAAVMDDLFGGAGNDSFSNAKTADAIVLGEGNDTVTATAAATTGRIDMGAGDDRVTNAGIIGGTPQPAIPALLETAYYVQRIFEIFANNGETAPSTIQLGVNMGDGNDVLTNTGNILRYIDMGAGNDTMTGGANSEQVLESAGADRYTLGAGADRFLISTMDDAKDTLDGGLGIDRLTFDNSFSQAMTIDFGAGTMRLSSLTDPTQITERTDVVQNIEQVIAGGGADSIQGSARAEWLAGGLGADTIAGGGGKDVLIGGGGADVFLFRAATDSTVARTGRDFITDFVQGTDHIQLTFDANTTNNRTANTVDGFDYGGIQYGNFTREGEGEAARFNPGELRYHYEGENTILRGDTNGDGIADFTIELRGHIALTSDDFLFAS